MMNGSMLEHQLDAEDYVIVINTHKEEIRRLKNQMLQHQEYISRLQEELRSVREIQRRKKCSNCSRNSSQRDLAIITLDDEDTGSSEENQQNQISQPMVKIEAFFPHHQQEQNEEQFDDNDILDDERVEAEQSSYEFAPVVATPVKRKRGRPRKNIDVSREKRINLSNH